MEKQDWQDLYNELETILSEFNVAYSMSKSGSNKQDVNNAESNAKRATMKAKRQIERYPEVYKLITGGNVFLYEEFFMPKYFIKDMPTLLSKIIVKIKNAE